MPYPAKHLFCLSQTQCSGLDLGTVLTTCMKESTIISDESNVSIAKPGLPGRHRAHTIWPSSGSLTFAF